MKEDLLKNKVKALLANKDYPDYFNDKERHLMVQNYMENKKEGPSIPETPTFWTTFSFKGTDPKDLHCTHKFLGEQNDPSVKKILITLDNYFSKNPFKSFKTVFGKEEFFGENAEVRVLTPFEYNEKNFLLDLKNKLNKFMPDDYPDYKPHVTTETIKRFDFPITGYCLLFGNTLLRKYGES
ncbi:hypothetical protein N9948_01290 [bacterium]|nr:hypothetical protein [bacterium]